MRFLLAALITALTLALPAQAGPSWATSVAANDVASWLAMRKVSVRCLTPEESAADLIIVVHGASAYVEGWVDRHGNWHPKNFTVFTYGLCETIDALASGDASDYTVDDLAWAVLVLTHEAGHLRGHRWSASEAKTEAWALRHFSYVVARLGVTKSAVRVLLYHAVLIHRSLPFQYLAPECSEPRVDADGRLRGCAWQSR